MNIKWLDKLMRGREGGERREKEGKGGRDREPVLVKLTLYLRSPSSHLLGGLEPWQGGEVEPECR